MLFTQAITRVVTAVAVLTCFTFELPAVAESIAEIIQTPGQIGLVQPSTSNTRKPLLIAQAATCASCGADLDPIVLLETLKSPKEASVLTDSLWGNLILELAYQRDPELQKISKKLNLLSIGTMGAIGGIAAGTLAQGISALRVLNPNPGHEDSYTPLIIGTALSTATLMVFAARILVNNKLAKQVSNRQTAIKNHVEAILAHMEKCNGKCDAAKKELTEMIGQRASGEWVDLFQSSHQLAMTSPRKFSSSNIPGHID